MADLHYMEMGWSGSGWMDPLPSEPVPAPAHTPAGPTPSYPLLQLRPAAEPSRPAAPRPRRRPRRRRPRRRPRRPRRRRRPGSRPEEGRQEARPKKGGQAPGRSGARRRPAKKERPEGGQAERQEVGQARRQEVRRRLGQEVHAAAGSSPTSAAVPERPAPAGRCVFTAGRAVELGERRRAVDQGDVGEALGEVAQEPAVGRVDLLRVQADVVRVAEHPAEDPVGPLPVADHGERLGQPEGADREGALLPLEPVRRPVAVDQLAVGAGDLAGDGPDRGDHPPVRPRKEARPSGSRARRRRAHRSRRPARTTAAPRSSRAS